MARAFDDGSSQFIYCTPALTTSFPFTMACWFNTDDLTTAQALMSNNDQFNVDYIYMYLNPTPDYLAVSINGASSSQYIAVNSSHTADSWYHACYVGAASNDHKVLLNAGNSGTSSTDVGAITSFDASGIGAQVDSSPSDYMSGMIAEAAWWNAALTDAEVAVLAAGYSPLLVRPQSLVAYLPLIRDDDEDLIGGVSFTASGSPTVGDHPPVRYAVGPYNIGVPAAAAGETLSIAIVPTDSSYDVAKPVIVG